MGLAQWSSGYWASAVEFGLLELAQWSSGYWASAVEFGLLGVAQCWVTPGFDFRNYLSLYGLSLSYLRRTQY